MKTRWISLGVVIGLALALTVGFAVASDRSNPAAGGDRWAGMEAMHDSPAMQRVHAQMPEELRVQCEAMHEQMDEMMQSGGMMGGDMGSHHSGTSGGMGPGSDGPGGMMGSGSSGMMGS